MDWIATFLLFGLGFYAAAGLVTGVAFAVCGVTAVQAAPVTAGARILLLPGATVLWPVVLHHWLRSRNSR